MPEFFDVVDDPTKQLFGHEESDEEGVPEARLSLVEKGVLKDFLRTRQPVRGYNESNGRARLNGSYGAELPLPTNLLITARRNQFDRGPQEEADRPDSAAWAALWHDRAQDGFSVFRFHR